MCSGSTTWDKELDRVYWLRTIVAVEEVRAFPHLPPTARVLQVVTSDNEKLYFLLSRAGATDVWRTQLQRLICQNRVLAEYHHPGLAKLGRWSCCDQRTDSQGCRRCTDYRCDG